MPAKARQRSGQISQQSAKRIEGRAKQLVAVASGETRDHIEAVKTETFTWSVISTRPSTDELFNVPAYLEYKVQPYLRPAFEEERSVFLSALAEMLNGLAR